MLKKYPRNGENIFLAGNRFKITEKQKSLC